MQSLVIQIRPGLISVHLIHDPLFNSFSIAFCMAENIANGYYDVPLMYTLSLPGKEEGAIRIIFHDESDE